MNKQPPLDPDTYARVRSVLANAQRQGRDPVEELHRVGLIATPANELKLKVAGMRFLYRELVSWRPVELLRRKFSPHHQCSPADMYACIAEFLEEHVSVAEGRKQ